jgi:hypothetical protein
MEEHTEILTPVRCEKYGLINAIFYGHEYFEDRGSGANSVLPSEVLS